jgi:uncharacterized protein YjbJ (UPF0337 family)
MPWDEIRSNWDRYRERLRSRWGRLEDFELDTVDGDRERLIERVSEAYGVDRDRAEREVMEFEGEEREARAPARRGDRAGRDQTEG